MGCCLQDRSNKQWMSPNRSTDEKRGGNVIGTLEDFQRELKKQFYPQYAEKEARAKLHSLTQQGTVQEHVRTFTMAEAESFAELGSMKDKFELSKPNGKGN
ncbi:hypothetical protein Golob_011704, partial [Gossypium lobatum]|nr:hypothetical protein [Gossypium lobatum]